METFHPTRGIIYDMYKVTYKDSNNIERIMTYNNVPGDLPMYVVLHTEDRANEIVWNTYLKGNANGINYYNINGFELSLEPVLFGKYDENLIDCQLGTAIQFTDLDISTLWKYDLMMHMEFDYSLGTSEEMQQIEENKELFVNLFNIIYQDVQDKNLTIDINFYLAGTSPDLRYHIYYDTKTNQAVLTERRR
jgi:hypothetical protein